jgi:uncharacterized protein (TIGR03067 family)
MVVNGDNITVDDASGSELYTGTVAFNENEDPNEFEVYVESSSIPSFVGETARGIYYFDGGTLYSVAAAPGSGTRPGSFTVNDDDSFRYFQFTR